MPGNNYADAINWLMYVHYVCMYWNQANEVLKNERTNGRVCEWANEWTNPASQHFLSNLRILSPDLDAQMKALYTFRTQFEGARSMWRFQIKVGLFCSRFFFILFVWLVGFLGERSLWKPPTYLTIIVAFSARNSENNNVKVALKP